MSSFCFGQQALLQGKDTKSKPQGPPAGKSKSTKDETPRQTGPSDVNDSHWSTKQIIVAFVLGIIAVIIFGFVVVERKNGTTRGNLIIITIKMIIIIIITVCIN